MIDLKNVFFALLLSLGLAFSAQAQDKKADYRLGAGDAIKISVFQNPDLTLETRVAESGTISYPLIGSVRLGGLSIAEAEKIVASKLREGGFVQKPQVNILLVQFRGNQVSVLGLVNRPGRYPIETGNTRVTDMIATAGGAIAVGADVAVLTGVREGKAYRREIDIQSILVGGNAELDIIVAGGDVIQVKGNQVSVLGMVNRPGRYPIETGNTRVTDILATAGGATPAGADVAVITGVREGKLFRKEIDMPAMFTSGNAELDIPVAGGDVVFINRAPVFYIYGEVQRGGSYRLERGMTVLQGLAQGAGLTARGTERGLRIHRRGPDGSVSVISPKKSDLIRPDDVLYVDESLF